VETANISGKEAGFTLVELLVVLALAGIITAGLVNFMISQSRNYNLQEDMQEMEQNARVALEFFARKIQNAYNVSNINMDDISDDDKYRLITIDESNDDTDNGTDYYLRFRTGDFSKDKESEKICFGSSCNKYIALFIGDADGDKSQDFPMFQRDPANRNVIIITIVARTRHRDPNYTSNRGFRTIVLTRKVFMRNA